MQAIVTRFQPATDSRGARMQAKCSSKRINFAYDHEHDMERNHQGAASLLAKQMGWHGEWTSGTLPTGDFVHTRFVPNVGRDFERFIVKGR